MLNASATRPDRFFTRLEKLLADLHVAILPVAADPSAEGRLEQCGEPGAEEARRISEAIDQCAGRAVEGLVEYYRTLPDHEEDVDRVLLLPINLREIYARLRRGLNLWQLNTADGIAEASWEWRFGYENFWGNHLMLAMRTIHDMRYRECHD